MRELTMDELKKVLGRNLVDLRRNAGMKQSELAEKLNYSDKAVSKWECGDAIPDILILTRLAALFHVTVDYLVTDGHTDRDRPLARGIGRTRTIITLLSVVLVWLLATGIYVFLAMAVPTIRGEWLPFVYALPISALLAFILSCVWRRRVAQYIFLSAFVWMLILSIYLSYIVFLPFAFESPWLIFLIGIPAQALIALWPGLKSHLKLPAWAVRDSHALEIEEKNETE